MTHRPPDRATAAPFNFLRPAILVMFLAACGTAAQAPSSSVAPEEGSPSATIQPTSTASESESTAPSATPSASPAPITAWRMTEGFDSSPATSYVTDVTAWNNGFVAIGSAWADVVHVNQEMPRVWTSDDGEAWSEQPAELGVEDVTMIGIAARADGRLLLVGRVPGSGSNPNTPSPRSVAWVSDDARTWQEVGLALTDDVVVDSFDHGPQGYALTAGGGVWFSAEGIDWAKTHDSASSVVAGDEGFVAIVIPEAAGPSAVIASADGQTWFASDSIAAPMLDVAPLGGDWVATGYAPETDFATIRVWHSADGLDWTPMLDVNDLTGPAGPKTGRGLNDLAINGASLSGGAGRAFLTLTNNHCCARMSWNYGVWESTDGTSWTAAVEGDAFVSSVVTAGNTTVLGGHLGRGDDAAFWIGDR